MEEYIAIQKEKVPALGLGTYQLKGGEGESAISAAISIGYRHVDTAQFYNNENIVGSAVKKSGIDRDVFFITTKIWPTEFSKAKFIPSVENSLRQLKMDYADLLLLHWPSDDTANERAIDLVLECQHKKYTRLIGVSNFNMEQIIKARKSALLYCNQLEYNPYINQDKMLKYLQENDMLLTAYMPLARGRINKDEKLISIAEKYRKTPTQVTLRWFLQQNNVSPIPKAGSEKHLLENIQIFDFEIDKKDMETISNIKN